MIARVGTPALTDRQIAGCFNATLGRATRVRLIGGATEPLYLPGGPGFATIRYTRDYAASALHELAHWCIAGTARRVLVDYGYEYLPPPRSVEARRLFQQLEVPVQSLEYRLSVACGLPFRVSLDDMDAPPGVGDGFAALVRTAAQAPASTLPPRARRLLGLLAAFRDALADERSPFS